MQTLVVRLLVMLLLLVTLLLLVIQYMPIHRHFWLLIISLRWMLQSIKHQHQRWMRVLKLIVVLLQMYTCFGMKEQHLGSLQMMELLTKTLVVVQQVSMLTVHSFKQMLVYFMHNLHSFTQMLLLLLLILRMLPLQMVVVL